MGDNNLFTYQAGGQQSAAFPNGGDPNYNYKQDNYGHQVIPAYPMVNTKGGALQSLLIQSINDPDSLTQLQIRLIQAGYLNPRARSFEVGNVSQGDATWYAMDRLMDKSIATNVPFLTILDKDQKRGAGKANYEYFTKKFGADGSQAGSTQPRTSTNTSKNISSPLEAESILEKTMQTFEGRNPTDTERKAFTAALQAFQNSNPTVSTTTNDGVPGGNSSTVTKGGVSGEAIGAFAENYATTGANQVESDVHSVHHYSDVFTKFISGG